MVISYCYLILPEPRYSAEIGSYTTYGVVGYKEDGLALSIQDVTLDVRKAVRIVDVLNLCQTRPEECKTLIQEMLD